MWMLIGFAIVLVTFVVKEIVRDELKRHIDSIDGALKAKAAADTDLSATAREFVVKQKLKLLSDQLTGPQTTGVLSKTSLVEETVELRGLYDSVATNVDRVSDVLETLPKEAKPLRVQREDVRKDLEKAHKHMEETIAQNTVAIPDAKNHALIILESVQVAIFGLTHEYWEKGVMESAKRWKKVLEARYLLCTWASYFLYVVGLVVAICGKLYDTAAK
jgi:aldehyde:ferredoxin oxidoreductase